MSYLVKKILKKLLGDAGAGLDQSVFGSSRLYEVIKAQLDGLKNRVLEGLAGAAPTTPSSQASGVGNTLWNVNIAAGKAVVNGVLSVIAAQVDFSIHTGSFLAGFINGDSVIAALVEKNVAGTLSTVAVKGTPAVTGLQVAPTQAEIQAFVGAGVTWVKLLETTLNRTGDTTVTQSYNNTVADIGVEVTVE